MNIAIVLKYLSFPINGGIQQNVAMLCKYLTMEGHKVTLITSTEIDDQEVIKGVNICTLKLINIKVLKWHFFLLNELIFNLIVLIYFMRNKINFDVIHTHGRNGIFLHYFDKYISKIVHTHHDLTINELKANLNFEPNYLLSNFQLILHGIIFNVLEKSVLKRMKRIITVSRKNFDEIKTIKPESNVSLIYNGVEHSVMTDHEINKFLLFIGNLSNRKGIPTLINAMSLIKHLYPDVKLYIVGDGKKKNAYLKLVSDLELTENIIFLGNVSESHKFVLLKRCYGLVHPSLAEGQGIVALEAMSCGKPVISSNIPGLNEVVENDITGLTFTVCDIKDLKNKIIKLLNDEELTRTLGRNGYRKVQSGYLWNIIVKEIITVYSQTDEN